MIISTNSGFCRGVGLEVMKSKILLKKIETGPERGPSHDGNGWFRAFLQEVWQDDFRAMVKVQREFARTRKRCRVHLDHRSPAFVHEFRDASGVGYLTAGSDQHHQVAGIEARDEFVREADIVAKEHRVMLHVPAARRAFGVCVRNDLPARRIDRPAALLAGETVERAMELTRRRLASGMQAVHVLREDAGHGLGAADLGDRLMAGAGMA